MLIMCYQEAVDMLLSGKFRWFFRRRLRITLTGDPAKITLPPVELKEQQLQYPEYRYMDLMNETGCDHPFKVGKHITDITTISFLTLINVGI